MKATGIVRNIDELGRIVIPKELRDTHDISMGTPMEIFCDGDNIVLRKYAPGCVFCKRTTEDLVQIDGVRMCMCCANDMAIKYRRARAGATR